MLKPFPQKALYSLTNLQDKTLSSSSGHKHPCLLHGIFNTEDTTPPKIVFVDKDNKIISSL